MHTSQQQTGKTSERGIETEQDDICGCMSEAKNHRKRTLFNKLEVTRTQALPALMRSRQANEWMWVSSP